jgi:RHS repeat-associated protein
MAGRKYNQGTYRYGFNGKEEDKEWGSQMIQDYGFRIYNPTIGKFLSMDPLAPDYPWYTPYQFAGNMPIWAIDLDGLEPLKTNGIITGYTVKAGQGPSHIAKDLRGNYGMKNITWKDIVVYNAKVFKKNANCTNYFDKNDPGYWKMNINEGDVLKIPSVDDKGKRSDPKVKTTPTPIDTDSPTHTNRGWTVPIGGIEANAGAGVGASAALLKFRVPNDVYLAEAGLNVTLPSASLTLTTTGADGTIQFGFIHFNSNSNVSIFEALNKEAITIQHSIVSQYYVGGKYTFIASDDYNANLGGFVMGTPGMGRSISTSRFSISDVFVEGMETKQDSIDQFLKVIRANPEVEEGPIHDYVRENGGG